MKRTIVLFAIILVLGAGWTFAWNYVAGEVENQIEQNRSRLAGRGIEANCEAQNVTGYPFRLSIDCSRVSYRDENSGFGFNAGALKTAAQVYQPQKLIAELESPAQLRQFDRAHADLDWAALRLSMLVNLDGPERVSIQSKNLRLQSQSGRFADAEMAEIQFHLRQVNEEHLDLALDARRVSSPDGQWLPFGLLVNTRFDGIYRQFLQRPDLLRIAKANGLVGELTGFHYVLEEGGSLSLSGPFDLKTNGLLSGDFRLKLRDVSGLVSALETAIPQQAATWQQIGSAVALLAQGNQQGEVDLTLTVRDGSASFGLIPVAKIPPLF